MIALDTSREFLFALRCQRCLECSLHRQAATDVEVAVGLPAHDDDLVIRLAAETHVIAHPPCPRDPLFLLSLGMCLSLCSVGPSCSRRSCAQPSRAHWATSMLSSRTDSAQQPPPLHARLGIDSRKRHALRAPRTGRAVVCSAAAFVQICAGVCLR
jgi:hypothetical protein